MDIFSNYQVAWECLFDKKRTALFQDVINRVVKPGMRVLDAGSGTGVMAITAAKAGAAKVYAVEIAPDLAKMIVGNAELNKVGSVIEVINKDITNWEPREKNSFDVVIMEMLDTGMLAEQQAHAINHLLQKGLIDKSTVLVPGRLDSYVQLVDYEVLAGGIKFSGCVQARNYGVLKSIKKKISRPTVYESVDLKQKISTNLHRVVDVRISESGIANGVLLKSKTSFPNGKSTFGTSDMCMPVIVPITPLRLKADDQIRLSLSYIRSEGFDKLIVDARRK